ncbi:hypothetical protein PG987_000056 [Apiospora arundinis]
MLFASRVAPERLPGWGTFVDLPRKLPSPNPPQDDACRSKDAPRCRRPSRLGHGRRTTPKPESPICDEQRPQLDLYDSTARVQLMIIDRESLRSWSGSIICASGYSTTTVRDKN